VVLDSGERTIWVSEAPHLSGRFVAFDLAREFALEAPPDERAPPRSIEQRR